MPNPRRGGGSGRDDDDGFVDAARGFDGFFDDAAGFEVDFDAAFDADFEGFTPASPFDGLPVAVARGFRAFGCASSPG
jgi:hypothetical protein